MRISLLLVALLAALILAGCEEDGTSPPSQPGYARITTSPDDLASSWTLSGPDDLQVSGRADTLVGDLDPGTYRVDWSAVAGWLTPTPSQALVNGGETTLFAGAYGQDPTSYGAARIATRPIGLEHRWTLTGPGSILIVGRADSLITGLPSGPYRVVWDAIEGWTAPAADTLSLAGTDTIDFSGAYTPDPTALGTLIIDAEPDFLDPAWSLVGPSGLTLSGRGDTLLTDMEPGDYGISWEARDDWLTPDTRTAMLFSFGELVLSGDYRLDAAHSYTLVIDVAPDDLDITWVLKVEMGGGHFDSTGTGDARIAGLPLAHQTLDWLDIPDWLTPDPSVVVLSPTAGQTLTVDGTYTPRPALPLTTVSVPGGSFQMGSPDTELGHQFTESPVHPVTLTRDLQVGVTEVTQGQWEAHMTLNPSAYKQGDNYPVDRVTWLEALQFCNALSAAEGLTAAYEIGGDAVAWDPDADGYRLPTEAEWEYICRAGATTSLATGELEAQACAFDSKLAALGWYCNNTNPPGRPQAVSSRQPNAWGLHDMHGNVMEWCWDVYDETYYAVSPAVDPTGPTGGNRHVVRGGAFNTWAQDCRCAARLGLSSSPSERLPAVGLRVVRNAP